MPLHRPQELRQFLDQLGVRPRKELSQNFLIDGNVLDKFITAGEVEVGDTILEIGPGPGAITERLLEVGAQVITVERDRAFAGALPRLDKAGDQLQVIEDDILAVDLDHLIQQRPAKVIANLPYHLTSPILAKLLPRHDLFSRIVVGVQDEVARRLTAQPNTPDYGHITLLVNAYSDAEYMFTISPNSFYPPPKVKSAVVAMKVKSPPLPDMSELWLMTRQAFQQRRKMLRSSLKGLYGDRIIPALTKLKFSETSRPEQLALEQFIALYTELTS